MVETEEQEQRNQQQLQLDGNNEELAIDGVLTTQPELGPSVPDGGYGWIVFLATLFFQALIPSLITSFGILLAFSRLGSLTKEDVNPFLWDDKLIYTPLLFIASWTFFDPTARALISTSTWPRLVATSGTCLTCAGLLFLWMGMAGYGEISFYPLAGIISGVGASIQMAQCEIILAQYFRLKHTLLAYISQAVGAVGFVLAPIIIGHHILNSDLLNIILWYQAVVIQGLIFGLTFKKPDYLKSKRVQTRYNYHLTNPDDEEDILSKNARELQIKRQDSTGNNVRIEKHEIQPNNNETKPKNWETFEEDDDDDEERKRENSVKYESLKEDWETFDDEEDVVPKKNWVKFEEETPNKSVNTKNLRLELSFAGTSNGDLSHGNSAGNPMPLFTDSPVNNNTSYAYDVLDHDTPSNPNPLVFAPPTRDETVSSFEILKRPTFYKSLLTVMTTKFSIFIYFSLFPLYMFQEIDGLRIKAVATVIGMLAIANVLFSAVSYWINIDKKRRPICMWLLCWMGSFGYFMTSDSNTEQVLIMGAVQVTVSIATLQYVGMPLLGLTLRGETNKEFNLISMMTGVAFTFFLFINSSFKNCFRLMALLHFFTGAVWFANYVYKKVIK